MAKDNSYSTGNDFDRPGERLNQAREDAFNAPPRASNVIENVRTRINGVMRQAVAQKNNSGFNHK